MIKETLILAGIMLLPFIEIRLAIPVGILTGSMNLPFGITLEGFGFPPLFVFSLALIMGFILAFLVRNFLFIFDQSLQKSKIGKRYIKLLHRMQKKIHPYVEKYGLWGLAIYISLPFPGSGIYSGSIAGYVIGMKKTRFYLAVLIGSTLASTIITSFVVLGMNLFI
jgi:uncharacterized membrane protein